MRRREPFAVSAARGVVDRLDRDRTDLAPDRFGHDVGDHVRCIGDRPENSQAPGRDARTAMTKDRSPVGVHSLDPIQAWSELQLGLDKGQPAHGSVPAIHG